MGIVIGLTFSAIFLYYQKNYCLNSANAIFSPQSKIQILNLIRQAKNEIDLEMYILTDKDVLNELVNAAQRGVKIRIILEYRVEIKDLLKIARYLDRENIQLRWSQDKYKLTHSKMMIIDKKKVLIGSINFSKSALENNREVGIIVEGEIVKEYLNEFEKDWQNSVPYMKELS